MVQKLPEIDDVLQVALSDAIMWLKLYQGGDFAIDVEILQNGRDILMDTECACYLLANLIRSEIHLLCRLLFLIGFFPFG